MLARLSIICLLLSMLSLLGLLDSEKLLLLLKTWRLTMWHLLLKVHHVDGSHSRVRLHCSHLSSIKSLCTIRH